MKKFFGGKFGKNGRGVSRAVNDREKKVHPSASFLLPWSDFGNFNEHL